MVYLLPLYAGEYTQRNRDYHVKLEDNMSLRDIVVEPLKYRDIRRAVATTNDAFKDDPLMHYVNDTPDNNGGRLDNAFSPALLYVQFYLWIHTKIIYTVNHGAAFAIGSYAKKSPSRPNGPSDRFFEFLLHSWSRVPRVRTAQQRRRAAEAGKKMDAVVEKTIGSRLDDMMYIDGLGTETASQGRGFGGAVLDTVTAIADFESRATWLLSSNIINTGFYNFHDFITVAEIILGDDDPSWKKPPVVICLMVREAHSVRLYDEKQEQCNAMVQLLFDSSRAIHITPYVLRYFGNTLF